MGRFKEPVASRNQLILMPQSLDEMVPVASVACCRSPASVMNKSG